MNLLTETIKAIEESGHQPDQIIFIGSEETGHQCTWAQFQELANREYYRGFGAQQVATDLIVVFSDGEKLWRGEYDGSEWWEFSKPFKAPGDVKPIADLFATRVGWQNLADINNPE